MVFHKDSATLVVEEGVTNLEKEMEATLGKGKYDFDLWSVETILLPRTLEFAQSSFFKLFNNLKTVVCHPESHPHLLNFSGSTVVTVQLPEKLEVIDAYCFSDCYLLKTVVLPENLREIGLRAFTQTFSLEKLDWPNRTIKLCDGCFINSGLKELKGVTLTVGGIETFRGSALREVSITLEENTRLTGTFTGCKSLRECSIKGNTGVSLNSTFKDCEALESVSLEGDEVLVLLDVFQNCTSLKQIEVPNSLKIFGSSVNGSEVLINGKLYNGDFFERHTKRLAVEETLREAKQTDVDFTGPCVEFFKSRLRPIGEIIECKATKDLPKYDEILSKSSYYYDKQSKTLTLREGLKELLVKNDGTVSDCFTILNEARKIVFPVSLESISPGAFSKCQNLEEIVFPKFCKLETLRDRVFERCCNLKKVSLPSKLEVIGSSCFCGCDSLESVEWPECPLTVQDRAFESTNLKSLDGVCFKRIGIGVFSDSNLERVRISMGNDEDSKGAIIGQFVFNNCKNLSYVEISAEVPTIVRENAFIFAVHLKSLILNGLIFAVDRQEFSGVLEDFKVSKELRLINSKNLFMMPSEIVVDDELLLPVEVLNTVCFAEDSVTSLYNGNYIEVLEKLKYYRTLGDGLRELYPEQFTVKEGLCFDETPEETSLF